MSITVVASSTARGSNTASTTLQVTLGAAVASGDTIALVIQERGTESAQITDVEDQLNGTWPGAVAGPITSAGATFRSWFLVFEDSAAGTPVIDITFDTSISSECVAIGLNGSVATPELDVLGTTYNSAGANETAPDTAAVSATAAGIFIAGITANNYQASAPTESGGATVGPASTADGRTFMASRAISVAGSEDFAFTGASSRWIIFQATFIEAAAANAVPVIRHLQTMQKR